MTSLRNFTQVLKIANKDGHIYKRTYRVLVISITQKLRQPSTVQETRSLLNSVDNLAGQTETAQEMTESPNPISV